MSVAERGLLERVAAIAREAGREILEVYAAGAIAPTAKADNSPLTAADLRSHRLIVPRLGGLIPGVPVLSEESASVLPAVRAAWQRYWLVDPLDGTREFLSRNGEFTVNIALIEDGVPVLGVVLAPALGRMFAAAPGTGALVEDAGGRRSVSAR